MNVRTKKLLFIGSMAVADSSMFNTMTQMIKGKPEMWNKAMKMITITTKTN